MVSICSAAMTGELLTRIDAFELDADGPPGYFAGKLARDNGWTVDYAHRVIVEYRRFLYLTAIAGHTVVPSDQVDMAWHQHLLDSVSYWDVFCPNVFGRPLHHRPNRDGQLEINQSEGTLLLYTETFGSPPPEDIWPPAKRRFGQDLKRRKVALDRNWVVPKRVAWWSALAIVAAGGVIVELAVIDEIRLPLSVYAILVIGLCAIAGVISLHVEGRDKAMDYDRRSPDNAPATIDPYDAALLSARSGVSVALVSLIRDNVLALDEQALSKRKNRYLLRTTGVLPGNALALEDAIYTAVAKSKRGLLIRDLYGVGANLTKAKQLHLCDRGLLVGPRGLGRRFVYGLPFLAAAVPIVALSWAAWPLAWGLFLIPILICLALARLPRPVPHQPSARGKAALAETPRYLQTFDKIGHTDVRNGRELAWIVALHGVDVLAGGEFAFLHEAITASAKEGGGGATGAGCGGGGCGGCGGCGG